MTRTTIQSVLLVYLSLPLFIHCQRYSFQRKPNCRNVFFTFVIENKIDFIFNFQLSIFNYQNYGIKLQCGPSAQPL